MVLSVFKVQNAITLITLNVKIILKTEYLEYKTASDKEIVCVTTVVYMLLYKK